LPERSRSRAFGRSRLEGLHEISIPERSWMHGIEKILERKQLYAVVVLQLGANGGIGKIVYLSLSHCPESGPIPCAMLFKHLRVLASGEDFGDESFDLAGAIFVVFDFKVSLPCGFRVSGLLDLVVELHLSCGREVAGRCDVVAHIADV